VVNLQDYMAQKEKEEKAKAAADLAAPATGAGKK
jgi:hypothetical protein